MKGGSLTGVPTPPATPFPTGPLLWERLRRELRNPYVLILLSAVAVYSCYWTWLSVSKYYGLVAAVYDLGLFAQHTWIFTQPGSVGLYGFPGLPGSVAYLALVVDQPFQFLLSPLGAANSYPTILILQSVALGTGALPLYAIARRILASDLPALFVSMAYLLYFPLAGVNWFDAHFIAFFIPLFLLGYYFLVQRAFRLAGLFLLLAGSTEYPSILLVLLFALTLIGEAVLNEWLLKRERDLPWLKFATVLFVVSLLFFVYQFVYLNAYLGPLGFAATVHTGNPGGVSISSGHVTIQNRVTVALFILTPVLFLPVLSPRWLVMLAPIGFLIFGTTYFGYAFPEIFRGQYSAVFIPFVFLGVVYALNWLKRFYPTREGRFVKGPSRLHSVRRLANPSTLGLAVLITVIVFATIFQPYGPLNSRGPDRFVEPSINLTSFNELQQLESLVPRNTPFVLFQNDMPGMLPRPLAYLDTPLVTGIVDWKNVSIYDAERGQFPMTLFSGHTVNATVQYAVDNPHNWGFLAKGGDSNDSMYDFIRVLYGSGMYGILGEVDGMIALERGYEAGPLLYSPFNQLIPAQDLLVPNLPPGEWINSSWNGSKVHPSQDVISVTNADSTHAWDGPSLTLSPGLYEVRFSLLTTNLSSQDRVSLVAEANDGIDTLGAENITGSNFTRANTWTSFNFTFYANNTYQLVGFPGLSVLWHGTLSIQSIDLTQLAPGSPRYSPTGSSS
ncbi:MAG: DUF2079 domain-containing protein [Thermoplasmata archaeon]